MKSAIVDTSFLVSLTTAKEKHHSACVQVAERMTSRLIVPITVLPETTHLITKRLSHRAMRAFIGKMQSSQWHIENVTVADIERAKYVLDIYHDAKLDFADSTIVAIAERMNINTILTLDRRDFYMIRPSHTDYFTILP